MRPHAQLFVALALAGCVATPPRPVVGDGWRVKTVRVPPPPTCTELGPVAVETTKQFESLVQPGTAVLHTGRGEGHLRDLAAGMGADTLLVHPPGVVRARTEDGWDSLVLSGVAYLCNDGPALADGTPVPQDAVLVMVSHWTEARSGPHPAAAVRKHLAPGTRVLALQAGRAGYRRVRAEDGTSIGFVEESALQPVR